MQRIGRNSSKLKYESRSKIIVGLKKSKKISWKLVHNDKKMKNCQRKETEEKNQMTNPGCPTSKWQLHKGRTE